MRISTIFQFVIGFFLGIIFFTAGITGAFYFFLTKLGSTPEKHIFAEEKSSPEETKTTTTTKKQNQPAQTTKVEDDNKTKTKKTSVKTQLDQEKLPPGAYFARVTWSTGLSLRAEPSRDAQRVGGVGYNAKIIILNTSDDRRWQKIRIPSSGKEAWVKAGNVAKVTDEE